jgi:hypothetical protein
MILQAGSDMVEKEWRLTGISHPPGRRHSCHRRKMHKYVVRLERKVGGRRSAVRTMFDVCGIYDAPKSYKYVQAQASILYINVPVLK